ncbi:MAG: methionine--tRNA ligase [Erysipelotrichaceae bacterium]|jgi:methionyl-tRNA synthetase|nr:methionine--tRNA ligase [Erysipelotrichaceae bacterium]
MKNKFYITTPIYYPSAKLHIGHAYSTTLADILARYHRLKGEETFFLTGSDEHGMKIEKNAMLANKTPQEFVDGIVVSFKNLWKALDISYDKFIRTTDESHVRSVQKIFSKLLKHDDIYLGSYEGWYCKECESFWTDIQVGPDHLCPSCGRPVEKASEATYFFKTTKYVDKLLEFYESHPNFLLPESRKNEMINTFIKPGLEDLSVSRTSFSWGIPISEDPKHVIYVWLDALTNYITALGYGSTDETLFKKFWLDASTEKVHILGADITRFHAIYWPMFLMALDLPLPDREFVHGLLMTKDGKMSKSKGNTIDPYPLIERYGVDAVRYYLAREIAFGADGQFTPEQFIERINMDLANNLGNLLNRSVSMINKYFDGVIPTFLSGVNPFDKDVEDLITSTVKEYEDELNNLHVTDAITSIMKLVGRANKYIDETMPWVLAKEGKLEELRSAMSHLARVLYVSGILLKPVLTTKSDLLLDQLGVPLDRRTYNSVLDEHTLDNLKVNKGEQLFPRLDESVEVPLIVEMMKVKK